MWSTRTSRTWLLRATSVTDFRLYPRGGRPGEGAASAYVYVLSERIPIPFADLVQKSNSLKRAEKDAALPSFDGESI